MSHTDYLIMQANGIGQLSQMLNRMNDAFKFSGDSRHPSTGVSTLQKARMGSPRKVNWGQFCCVIN